MSPLPEFCFQFDRDRFRVESRGCSLRLLGKILAP
jgi:hypothetical protein